MVAVPVNMCSISIDPVAAGCFVQREKGQHQFMDSSGGSQFTHLVVLFKAFD